MELKQYVLRVQSDVQGVQWVSGTPETLAEEIVNWVNREGPSDDAASYCPTAAGALGPHDEDWGDLTLRGHGTVTTVAPYDYVVKDATGVFYAVERERFEGVYREDDLP